MFTTKDLDGVVTGTPDERIDKMADYLTHAEGFIDAKRLAAILSAILSITKSEIRDRLAIEESQGKT